MVEAKKILEDLDRCAIDVLNGNIQSLNEIRRLIVDLDLMDIVSSIDKNAFAVLYLARRLLDDFWYNLATDASFDSPDKSPLGELFSKDLSTFIHFGIRLGHEKTDEGKTLTHLINAINDYYSILLLMEKKTEEVYRKEVV